MKEFVEELLPAERDIFFALNGSESLFFDNVMWTISGRFIWVPVMLFILFIFFFKTRRNEAILVTLFFILLFVAADQISSSFFKPFFERYRPTHHPDFKDTVDIVNGYRGGRYGFISGHATNSFAIAVFLSLVLRNGLLTFSSLLWATINSYTRIYLGVHFISDIVAGMIVGTLIAFIIYGIYTLVRKAVVNPPSSRRISAYDKKKGTLLAVFILLYLFIITIFSPFLATLPH
ncbi:phosphatase PAP2 family protein [Proteiniphilum sp.]|jgi:undecaprenyl-diphosphatase|uniref:phosphatase PAP2 family protein n=1 Tax=Proteiniphilum sp. TaxID=1926877 RepID=UPI000926CEAD|nr:phosphatase PAP2 family protein [Proteiniphilum sp.]MEA5127819.1 phosphatase PAP2 family protein [Proteiniphilum sp.]OJV90869.1 MAG: phospholipid phosphatase [Bacteroidia bacterium 44-10]